MDILNIIIFIAAVINLVLGVLIYKKGNNKKINNAYIALAFSIFFWGIAKIIYRATPTVESSIFWDRILYVIPVYVVACVLHFVYIFPEGENKQKKWFYPFITLTSLGMTILILFTDSVIESVDLIPGEEKFMEYGDHYNIYSAYIACYFAWSWIVMLKKMRNSYGIVKAQATIVFAGIFISSFSSIITNVIFLRLGIFKFVWAGHILILFMVVFIAYAIVRHRLMDIKMVLRSSSVYLASLGTILAVVICANAVFYKYFQEDVYWTNLFLLILATSSFAALKKKYFQLANKYFFSSLYDPQKLIAELSDFLRTTLNVEIIYNHLFTLMDKAFHPKAFAVLSYKENKGAYYLEFNHGFDVGRRKRFDGSEVLHDKLIGRNRIIVTEEVKRDFYNDNTKEVVDLLINLGIDILVPLNIKDKTVGLIAMGKKESNDLYSEADLEILKIVGAQAATAVENAFLYEKTLNFNAKLKDEVRKATRELVKANNKLKKLDEAKSEFISIASHQLRTPLTIIKGYISMILEGNFGELTPGEKESLEKVYLSNERLIGLVENLLNISRIESGRLQFDYKKMQLETIIDSVFEELQPKAKEKNLKFIYKKTKKKFPAVKIDEEKIRQVVINMADNAIKYTKKGSVTISLKKVIASDPKMGECLEFKVSDSGMGISPDDLPNLFKKFSRGTGTSLIHTEGTGLGLYVAKQMIEAHGGKAWAESEGEGKGSKFCFRIPIKDSARKEEV